MSTPNPPPADESEGRVVFVLTTSPAWRAWLKDLGKHMRSNASECLREAARRMAETEGFRAPPPI